MRKRCLKFLSMFAVGAAFLVSGAGGSGAIKVLIEQNDNASATAGFKFQTVPPPAKADAGAQAKFTIVDGERDPHGGNLDQLHDGRVPTDEDQPSDNFFFKAGTDGGRIGRTPTSPRW